MRVVVRAVIVKGEERDKTEGRCSNAVRRATSYAAESDVRRSSCAATIPAYEHRKLEWVTITIRHHNLDSN